MKNISQITDYDIVGDKVLSNAVPRESVRAILFDNDGKIALLHIVNSNFYSIPGGGIEDGENIKDAFKRELLEETGCDAEITGELGYIDENRGKIDFTQRSYCYFANVIGEKGQPHMTEQEIDEGTTIEWHDINTAAKLVEGSVKGNYRIDFITTRDLMFINEAIKRI